MKSTRRFPHLRILISIAILICRCGDEEGVPEFEYPPLGSIPFPSDIYLDEDGNVGEIPGLEAFIPKNGEVFRTAVEDMQGFGLSTAIYFFFEEVLDPSSLPDSDLSTADESPIVFIEIDTDSGAGGERVRFYSEVGEDGKTLALLPEESLAEGKTYAILILGGALGEDGDLDRSEIMEGVLDGGAGDPVVGKAMSIYLPVLEYLIEEGVVDDASQIREMTVFTTHAVTREMKGTYGLLEEIGEGTGFYLCFPDESLIFDGDSELDALLGIPEKDEDGRDISGFQNETGVAHDMIGVVATGVYSSVNFKRDDTGTDAADDGTFERDEEGLPVAQGMVEIPVTLVLPKEPPEGEEGYPVVIAQHGFGEDRTFIFALANRLAEEGFATAGIDTIHHGSRGDATDEENNFAEKIGNGFTGDPDLADGFGDDPSVSYMTFFESFSNLLAMRDNFRQTVCDLMALLRTLKDGDLDLSPLYEEDAPRLDGESVYFLGNSLGGLLGTIFLSMDDGIAAGILNVTGGGFIRNIFTKSAQAGSIMMPLFRLIFGLPDDYQFDEYEMMINLFQWVFEPADPIIFADLLHRPFPGYEDIFHPKDILLIEVVGDEFLPNRASEALALRGGFSLLSPFLDEVQGLPVAESPVTGNIAGEYGVSTGVMAQYSPAAHGSNIQSEEGVLRFIPGFPFPDQEDPFPQLPGGEIYITNPYHETLDQVARFFVSRYEKGIAEVISTHTPVADFDDDGVPDGEDAYPYDPDLY